MVGGGRGINYIIKVLYLNLLFLSDIFVNVIYKIFINDKDFVDVIRLDVIYFLWRKM